MARPHKSRLPRSPAHPVRVLVADGRSPRRKNGWKTSLLTTLLLLSMVGLVAEGGWVAVQLIVNPGSVSWLGWLLPEWNRAPLSRYQTLREVQAEAKRTGLTAQDMQISLGKDERLVAILSADRCNSTDINPCQQIVELRVYRRLTILQPHSRDRYLDLIDRLTITGPREIAALAPLLSEPGTSPGTNRPLPLDKVAGMPGATAPGIWLNLSGEWHRGSDRLAYGQIVRYDRHRLSASIHWTSPNGVYPTWQQVTGSKAPELVVDQTVGLEPDFKVYQVQSAAKAIDLKAISLTDARQGWTYQNGLTLARHGLWTPALKLMQAARGGEWSADAQAQLDLIALHAAVTQAQADRTWSNPSQGIAANLIDGRWTKALQLLQAALTEGYEVKDLLTADLNRLWGQVGIALSVSPQQPDVQAWGALILFVQKGRSAAVAWLQQRNSTIARPGAMGNARSETIDSRLQQVLNLMNKTLLVADHPSRIVGTVAPIGDPNLSDWLLPSGATLTKDAGQAWYRIQVDSFYDGKQWRRSPFELNLSAIGKAQQLWSLLGLATDPQIQIIVWDANGQPQTLQATIKATQLRGGVQLLASGDAPNGVSFAESAVRSPPLAMTTATVRWIEPPTISVSALNQQDPRLTAALLPVLWQISQPAASSPVSTEEMLQTVGEWSVRRVALTGGLPDAIVSIPAASDSSSRPRSLIFSDQGTLIYSQVGREAGESLTAIAEADDSNPALLTEDGQTYRLKRWSPQRQRFE